MTKIDHLFKRTTLMRTIAMPANTNANGDIFGGWIMSQMDIAGGILARKVARGRVVTVAVNSMKFHLPIHVGDIVTWYGAVLRTGTTSVALTIEVWVQRDFEEKEFCVTEGEFTFVAIDSDGKPKKIDL